MRGEPDFPGNVSAQFAELRRNKTAVAGGRATHHDLKLFRLVKHRNEPLRVVAQRETPGQGPAFDRFMKIVPGLDARQLLVELSCGYQRFDSDHRRAIPLG